MNRDAVAPDWVDPRSGAKQARRRPPVGPWIDLASGSDAVAEAIEPGNPGVETPG